MVLENTFMELVKKIRGKASENVAMRKIGPERVIDGTYSLFFELRQVSSLLMFR